MSAGRALAVLCLALAPCAAQDDTAKPAVPVLGTRPWVADRDAWRALPTAERRAQKEQVEATVLAACRASFDKAWKQKDSAHFLVVSNDDADTTRDATNAAEAMFAWCEARFGDVSDEYVRRRPLVVYRAAGAQPDGLILGGRGPQRGAELDVDRPLLVTPSGGENRYATLFADIVDVYLLDKDPLLYRYLPSWFERGIETIALHAVLDDKKLVFELNEYERDDGRALVKSGGALTLRQIMKVDQGAFEKLLTGDGRHELTRAVRFLLLGPGTKLAPTKDFAARYLRAVVDAIEARRKEWPETLPTDYVLVRTEPGVTEVPELAKLWHAQRSEVATLAFEATCGKWTAKDWAAVDKAFAAYTPVLTPPCIMWNPIGG